MEAERLSQILNKHGYAIKTEIGHGTFAKCYLCDSEKYNSPFVCKVIRISPEIAKKGYETTFYSELNALIKLMHPNVINIYDHFCEEEYYVLVLEYCSGGNLLQYIEKWGPIEPYKIIILARQILECLTYVHSNNICHHDIKPSNIFIDAFNRVKLADFGISQILQKNEMSIMYGGSIAYLAPEVFQKLPYDSFKADIWSFGVTLYQMITGGNLPYCGNNIMELLHSIFQKKYILPKNCPKELRMLLKNSLNPNPEKRWTAKQLRDYLQSVQNSTPISTPRRITRTSSLREKSFSQCESPYSMPSLVRPVIYRKVKKITL